MTRLIWPLGTFTIDAAPDHPALQAIGAALEPLCPFLRQLSFDAGTALPEVVLGLGSRCHPASIRLLDEDMLLLDFPVGDMLHTDSNLLKLLQRNANNPWPFRIDSLTPPHPVQAVVIIEHRLPLTDVHLLSQKMLEGWQHKLMAEGLLHFLNGKGAHE